MWWLWNLRSFLFSTLSYHSAFLFDFYIKCQLSVLLVTHSQRTVFFLSRSLFKWNPIKFFTFALLFPGRCVEQVPGTSAYFKICLFLYRRLWCKRILTSTWLMMRSQTYTKRLWKSLYFSRSPDHSSFLDFLPELKLSSSFFMLR